MTWKPFTSQHAIERVRIAIHFAQPIQPKQSSVFGDLIEARRSELGFGARTMRPTNVIQINAATGEQRVSQVVGVWTYSRTTSEGATLEVLLLDQSFLVYEAAFYERWETFRDRYDEISIDLRARIHESINVRAVALEYVDRFSFEGAKDSAMPAELVREAIIGSMPEDVLSGREPWHVHRGWFEGDEPKRFLMNQNIAAQEIFGAGSEATRGAELVTKVERQSSDGNLDISELANDLNVMHALSKRVVTDALTDSVCERVGLL